MMITLEIIATLTTLFGVALIASLNIKGLYLMVISQALWFCVSVQHALPWLGLQSLILFFINIFGIFEWRRKGIKLW